MWTDEQLELLASWIGKKASKQIIEDFHWECIQRSWAIRTDTAVDVKLKRLATKLKKSVKATKDNWSMRQLERMFDIPLDRIRAWVRQGLPRRKYARNLTGISKEDLRQFAKQYPEKFWGIEPNRLQPILGGLRVSVINKIPQPTEGVTIPVIRLDTGEVIKSARAAAIQLTGSNDQSEIDRTKANILRSCRRLTPTKTEGKKVQWYQLVYPMWWVQLSLRKKFEQLSGRLFFAAYHELKRISGVSKVEAMRTAHRLAGDVSKICYQSDRILMLIDIDAEADTLLKWRLLNIKQALSQGIARAEQFTHKLISRFAWKVFDGNPWLGRTPKQSWYWATQYAQHMMAMALQRFRFERNLPLDWQADTNLKVAEFLLFTRRWITRKVGRKRRQIVELRAIDFINTEVKRRKNECLADLSNDAQAEEGELDGVGRSLSHVCVAQHESYEQKLETEEFFERLEAYLIDKGRTVEAKYLRLYLQGYQACEIEKELGVNSRERDYLNQRFVDHARKFAHVTGEVVA